MISRYSRPQMSELWSDRRRYLKWLEVEMAVCAEMARLKKIPARDWKILKAKADALIKQGGVKSERVDYHEKITHHDLIAFTTAVAEKIGPTSRYIHFGLTSSDVVDSALSMMTLDAAKLIRSDILLLLTTLKKLAKKYKNLPTIGRSHGIFAEPTSFGLKFLGWYTEWKRNLERLDQAVSQMGFGKLSGAVGANPHWGVSFEARVLKKLGLKPEPVSTQVVPRDRHAQLMFVLAVCGSSLERIAIELRHLQRSEVGEVIEGFRAGQKGSSAMPHKKNPISSENITGCARMLRAYLNPSLENMALWHERDISHSSVERVATPDAMILLDYALNRMNGVLEKLHVRTDQVESNLKKAGHLVFSGHYLLALVEKGVTRENAYRWIQESALKSLEAHRSFVELLEQDKRITAVLAPAEIKKLASLKFQLRNIGQIYKRAL